MDRLTLENQFKIEASNRVIDQMTLEQAKDRLKYLFRLAVENDQHLANIKQALQAQDQHIELMRQYIEFLEKVAGVKK